MVLLWWYVYLLYLLYIGSGEGNHKNSKLPLQCVAVVVIAAAAVVALLHQNKSPTPIV